MTNRYSLGDYILTIEPPTSLKSKIGSLTIGGQGNSASNLHDTFTVKRNGTLFSTDGYATGGFVHNKSYDKTGTVSVNLSQISPEAQWLLRLITCYYNGDYDGCTLTLTRGNESVVTANSCYPADTPERQFGETASKETYTFTCGKIDIN